MIGNNIKRLMKQNGYTQRELALRSQCTESTISKYIHNERNPSLKILKNLAISLGVSVDELLEEKIDIRELEKLIKQKGYNIKVLYCEEIGGEYWIIYTTDMDYIPEKQLKNRQYLEEKEEDIIAVDIEDAATQIVATLKGGAE